MRSFTETWLCIVTRRTELFEPCLATCLHRSITLIVVAGSSPRSEGSVWSAPPATLDGGSEGFVAKECARKDQGM